MLKTLKWIYKLGYKHAEEKYYHALVRKSFDTQPAQFEMFGIEDQSRHTREALLKRDGDARRLQQLIDDVFHPVEYMTQEEARQFNRFEP